MRLRASDVAAGDFVREDSFNDGALKATNVGVLDDKITATGLAVAFSTAGMLWRRVVKPESWPISSSAGQMVLLASCKLPAAGILVGVDVISVHVDVITMMIARADKLWRGCLLQLRNRHTKVLTEP